MNKNKLFCVLFSFFLASNKSGFPAVTVMVLIMDILFNLNKIFKFIIILPIFKNSKINAATLKIFFK